MYHICVQNTSVLENHHCRTALSIFRQTRVFEHLDTTTMTTLETQLKSLVLATDMANHQQQLNEFKVRKHLVTSFALPL